MKRLGRILLLRIVIIHFTSFVSRARQREVVKERKTNHLHLSYELEVCQFALYDEPRRVGSLDEVRRVTPPIAEIRDIRIRCGFPPLLSSHPRTKNATKVVIKKLEGASELHWIGSLPLDFGIFHAYVSISVLYVSVVCSGAGF